MFNNLSFYIPPFILPPSFVYLFGLQEVLIATCVKLSYDAGMFYFFSRLSDENRGDIVKLPEKRMLIYTYKETRILKVRCDVTRATTLSVRTTVFKKSHGSNGFDGFNRLKRLYKRTN